jgi:hypothetical protein
MRNFWLLTRVILALQLWFPFIIAQGPKLDLGSIGKDESASSPLSNTSLTLIDLLRQHKECRKATCRVNDERLSWP